MVVCDVTKNLTVPKVLEKWNFSLRFQWNTLIKLPTPCQLWRLFHLVSSNNKSQFSHFLYVTFTFLAIRTTRWNDDHDEDDDEVNESPVKKNKRSRRTKHNWKVWSNLSLSFKDLRRSPLHHFLKYDNRGSQDRERTQKLRKLVRKREVLCCYIQGWSKKQTGISFIRSTFALSSKD